MVEFEQCQTCYGWCCGAMSFTILRPGEVQRIANYLEIPEEIFRERYIKKRFDNDDTLPANPCMFWTSGQCAIHPVKPATCAQYGFRDRIECSSFHKEKMIRDALMP